MEAFINLVAVRPLHRLCNLGTVREWYRTNTIAGGKTWGIDFEIQRDPNSAIVATGHITLQPTVE